MTAQGPEQTPQLDENGEIIKKRTLRAANLTALRDRSLYPLIIKLSIWLIPLAIIVWGWGFYQRTHKPPQEYYAVNDDKFYRMSALKKPNLTTEALFGWAIEAATACYTFDFFDYAEKQRRVRPYFTEPGYTSYLNAIRSAQIIETIVQKKLVISAVPTDTPVILREGATADGVYAWRIQFPMLLTYVSASERTEQNVVLTLLIAEVPTTQSVKGIGIASFVAREASAQ